MNTYLLNSTLLSHSCVYKTRLLRLGGGVDGVVWV
ncbi:hypothetical protein I7I48_11997 [Histoplasma ohiense]|nr:hypothetical protein I7I48_11997 [Histoplasma ohiense (nom. inval.)]